MLNNYFRSSIVKNLPSIANFSITTGNLKENKPIPDDFKRKKRNIDKDIEQSINKAANNKMKELNINQHNKQIDHEQQMFQNIIIENKLDKLNNKPTATRVEIELDYNYLIKFLENAKVKVNNQELKVKNNIDNANKSNNSATSTNDNNIIVNKHEQPNGDLQYGQMFEDVRHGYGIYTFKNGSIFMGVCDKNNLTQGVQKNINNEIYLGKFNENKKEGLGLLFKDNEQQFNGEFRDGISSGFAIWVDQTRGWLYEGQVNSMRKSGKGTLKHTKWMQKGQFENDRFNGQGEYQFQDVKSSLNDLNKNMTNSESNDSDSDDTGRELSKVQLGYFVDDMFEGRGVMRTKDFIQEGEFKANMFNGVGSYVDLKDGSVRKVMQKNDQMLSDSSNIL